MHVSSASRAAVAVVVAEDCTKMKDMYVCVQVSEFVACIDCIEGCAGGGGGRRLYEMKDMYVCVRVSECVCAHVSTASRAALAVVVAEDCTRSKDMCVLYEE